jgi:hypothetical protein
VVERILGKAEVVSSILTGSTIFLLIYQEYGSKIRADEAITRPDGLARVITASRKYPIPRRKIGGFLRRPPSRANF